MENICPTGPYGLKEKSYLAALCKLFCSNCFKMTEMMKIIPVKNNVLALTLAKY